MAINNKILLQHLKEHFGTSVPIGLLPFIDTLNEVYNQNTVHLAANNELNGSLVKSKNKTKTAEECERLKAHNSLVQKAAKTGSWELDYPANKIPGHGNDSEPQDFYFSDEIYKILGLDPGSDAINKDLFFPQISPYDLGILLENTIASGQASKHYEEEHTLRMNDGTEKTVLKQSDIFFSKDDGSPSKIIGTLQDITEKKKLESALQNSAKKKESILQNLFNAYLSYDVINNKVLYSNLAFQKIFEDTPLHNKTSEASFLSLICEDDKTGAYSLLRKLAKGETAGYNFRILLSDNSFRWMESRLVPTLNTAGRLVQIELIAEDVTTYKIAHKSVNDLRADFHKQLFNVGEVVLLLNDKLELTYVSDNMTRLLGFMPDDLMGESLLQLVNTEDHEKVKDFYKNIPTGNKNKNRLELRLLSTAGDDIWCECVVHNMTDNVLIGAIVTRVRDVTFFKEQESKLVTTIDELKRTNANLEDFVSVVSHDLRAPLSSMQGILGLINIKDGSDNFSEELNYLSDSITKLDNFIIDLLNYSKCTKTELRPESIYLEQLLDDTTTYLKFMNAQNAPVNFKKNVKNGVLFYSDPKMINIILNNLISNAIRYSNPNAAAPFVEVKINANDVDAQIEVIDNGIGISREDQEKVFDMFYRVSDDNNGTGMGLHLVKLAVEKLSGKISVESEYNVGTKFLITIPNMLNNHN